MSWQNEKLSLPGATQNVGQKRGAQRGIRLLRLVLFAALAWSFASSLDVFILEDLGLWFDIDLPQSFQHTLEPSCAQVPALTPERNGPLWNAVGEEISGDAYKTRAINWLSGAVQVPTESYDDMGEVEEDQRWDSFAPFQQYLASAFPAVFSTLTLTKVNTYGLLFEWVGSDKTLKPILLAAHQDVVPVDPTTVDQWTHPPYSGFYDGTRIWGRGSSDDKSGLIGSLSAIETLIEKGFKPARTIVLAYGFDEEISGHNGAGRLSDTILAQYGQDSFALIVDEGGGFSKKYGTIFATPGIAEKGYLDVRVEVSTAGGHSSVPPSHTSIGILSALLVEYESNPYVAHITKDTTLYETLQCYSEHGASVPKKLKKAIQASSYSKRALRRLEKLLFPDPSYKSLVGTTQAIDLINGGVKANALPEQAWAIVNHRIATTSSVGEVQKHDTSLLKSLAAKFNLTFTSFGSDVTQAAPSKGSLTLSDAFGNALEPAPVTPTQGDKANPYRLLSGTIKATFNAHRKLKGDDNIVVAPGMPTGNTDTRYYWKLSPHIFRYNHRNSGTTVSGLTSGVHTVNEFIEVDAFTEIIRFFTTLILNADESTEL